MIKVIYLEAQEPTGSDMSRSVQFFNLIKTHLAFSPLRIRTEISPCLSIFKSQVHYRAWRFPVKAGCETCTFILILTCFQFRKFQGFWQMRMLTRPSASLSVIKLIVHTVTRTSFFICSGFELEFQSTHLFLCYSSDTAVY